MQIGEYAITAVISCGRHATVVQARDAAGRFVALKLPTTTVGEELIAHEQQVLSTLSRAVDAGMYDGRPYSATDWVVGAEARVVAADSADRRHLLQVCRAVARAYAGVHAAGVVHGQVHPRHVLMEDGADATLLDFSVAASAGIAPPPARLEARFSSLAAPEQARALLEGREPRLTPEAEQFSVAALLYLLVTGRMYATLRLQRDLLPVDIVDASPSPFADLGLEPWPDLERVLARSMSRDPTQRYPSAAALLAALEEIGAGAERVRRDLRSMSALAQKLQEFRRDTYSTEAIRSLAPPTCSINFGAAGVAFALTRLGTITGDPVPIEHAGRWLSAADERSNDPDAFDDGDELTPESIGSVSPFHALSGLAVARAFWSEAVGDEDLRQAALDEYRVATARPCDSLDLTLGRSSVLLVAGLLLDRTDPALPAAGRLASYGDELCEAIWRDVEDQRLPYNGIAHGWAGLAYASMLWSRVRGVAPPPGARRALEMLAALAEPFGRGARWLVSPNGRSGRRTVLARLVPRQRRIRVPLDGGGDSSTASPASACSPIALRTSRTRRRASAASAAAPLGRSIRCSAATAQPATSGGACVQSTSRSEAPPRTHSPAMPRARSASTRGMSVSRSWPSSSSTPSGPRCRCSSSNRPSAPNCRVGTPKTWGAGAWCGHGPALVASRNRRKE